MNLSILFWFYKDAPLCANHLRYLRRRNPGVSIFGLYSGDPDQSGEFETGLGPLLDDFFVFDEPRTDYWKWANGDLVIAEWYRRRGFGLQWDTVFVASWDILVTAPVREVFATLPPGHLLLSNVRPLSEVEPWWIWVQKDRANFDRFFSALRSRYGSRVRPLCCQFIVVCLPRIFLEKFAAADPPEDGFVEYRVPTFAALLDIPVYRDPGFDTVWPKEPGRPGSRRVARALNPGIEEISLLQIVKENFRRDGMRIFHPVERTLPMGPVSLCSWLRDILTGRRGRLPSKARIRAHLVNKPSD